MSILLLVLLVLLVLLLVLLLDEFTLAATSSLETTGGCSGRLRILVTESGFTVNTWSARLGSVRM